jgi:hypothetical protein
MANIPDKFDADSKIKLFESQHIRSEWDAESEKWWFSVLDVVAVLTDQPDYKKVRNYWKWLKNKLIAEGSQLVSATNQLKLPAADGKKYLTDVADTEQILRLIQSIPSKRSEPFKLWLAEVGSQRLDQLQDPELSIEQAMRDYKRLGYTDNWINQRLKSIEIRNRRVEKERLAGRATVRLFDRRDLQNLGRQNRQGIQAAQGPEERESARQHDQQRVDHEHAGRAVHQRNLRSRAAANAGRPRRCGQARRRRGPAGAAQAGSRNGQKAGQPAKRQAVACLGAEPRQKSRGKDMSRHRLATHDPTTKCLLCTTTKHFVAQR